MKVSFLQPLASFLEEIIVGGKTKTRRFSFHAQLLYVCMCACNGLIQGTLQTS